MIVRALAVYGEIETFALVSGRKIPQVKAELASHRIVRASR